MEVRFLYFTGTSKIWIPSYYDFIYIYDIVHRELLKKLCQETYPKTLYLQQWGILKVLKLTHTKTRKRKQRGKKRREGQTENKKKKDIRRKSKQINN